MGNGWNRMNNKSTARLCLTVAGCMLPLCMMSSVAPAGSVTQPGSTVGTAPGAPLAPGFYFSNTADWGFRDPNTRLFVDHPVYTWSTPWMIFGARFQVMAETAFNAQYTPGNRAEGYYNPLLTGQLAWDLGNGWGLRAFGPGSRSRFGPRPRLRRLPHPSSESRVIGSPFARRNADMS